MNIFALSDSPVLSAVYQHDKHVVKMTLESAQLISQAIKLRSDWTDRLSTSRDYDRLYGKTHIHHPCAKWARKNPFNFKWLCEHGMGLAAEYKHRFGRVHKSREVIHIGLSLCNDPHFFDGFTERDAFAMAMPHKYKTDDPVLSYRLYYINEKIDDKSKWTDRRTDLPDWLFKPAIFPLNK